MKELEQGREGEAEKNQCSWDFIRIKKKMCEEREKTFEELLCHVGFWERREMKKRVGNINYNNLCCLTHFAFFSRKPSVKSCIASRFEARKILCLFGTYWLSDQESFCLAILGIQSAEQIRRGPKET